MAGFILLHNITQTSFFVSYCNVYTITSFHIIALIYSRLILKEMIYHTVIR